jgi:hypothetical protein
VSSDGDSGDGDDESVASAPSAEEPQSVFIVDPPPEEGNAWEEDGTSQCASPLARGQEDTSDRHPSPSDEYERVAEQLECMDRIG